ncbi:aspartate/glutamate racemase family protein [Sphingobium nicotianae]|uniref:Amino acid racemase n=1 Tax=Sphingobium nicotianae TaxID=2782607 RepID=A0A9X1AJ81_9SPHN|nr:amino acid racemase [Sphingobium nicotianae]MBT2185800.1 amino acid racemase [Sphingobium nicotianae]
MKKLGLIGGLSWSSTARYYDLINRAVQRELGGLHSATLLIDSLDFAEVARCTSSNDWDCAAGHMIGAAKSLEAAGAEALMICANSLHKVASQIESSIGIPVINIIDEIGAKLKADKIKAVALVGTSNVMMDRDYRQKLVQTGGVSLLPADAELAGRIDRMVYDELAAGKITRDAERYMKSELTDIAKEEVQAVVLACTELELIVDVHANVLPIYDSTIIHAAAGARFILNG